MGILLRVLPIGAAYVVSTLVASASWIFIFNVAARIAPAISPAPPPENIEVGIEFFLSIAFLWAAFFVSALLPSAALIAYAENTKKRSLRFYAMGGAVIAALFSVVAIMIAPILVVIVPISTIPAGALGGIAYWFVAGRTANRWRIDRA